MSQEGINITVVVGASSEIAMALIRSTLARDENSRVVAISRKSQIDVPSDSDRLQYYQSDYSEESISAIALRLEGEGQLIRQVFLCNGVLHNDVIFPERRLEELSLAKLQEVMQVNAFLPALWLKHLKPVIKKSSACAITAFSARVGSISDNKSGGWYAYRASKAALNMLMKSASIEYQKFKKDLSFVVFHPGTTDTPLSVPFQKSVPADKLFTPGFVAESLLELLADNAERQAIQFLAWDGSTIDW